MLSLFCPCLLLYGTLALESRLAELAIVYLDIDHSPIIPKEFYVFYFTRGDFRQARIQHFLGTTYER